MSKFVLLNVRVYAGATDLSGVSNQIEMNSECEEKDTTAFASGGWHECQGGLFSTEVSGGGQFEATSDLASQDNSAWSYLSGRTQHPWSVVPDSATPAVGDLCYFTKLLRGNYKLGDTVGEVAPWEGNGSGSSPLLRGSVAHPPGTARIATGVGTGLNLGALSSTQRLYAALHVLSVSGTAAPTITARVESDADNTWASPTTQATFGAAVLADLPARGQFVNVAGPITDAWWRVAWTISGTTPSFLFLASLGIA